MESASWTQPSSGGMYSYYPADHGRSSSDRSTVLPPPHTIPIAQQSHDDEGSRRYAHQHASSAGYPHNPSPATQAPTNGMALPPFNSFYQSSTYHSPQQQHAPGSAPAGLHPLPPHAMYAHGQHAQHAQHAQHPSYGYPMASPASMQPGLPGSRQPGPYSHSESPRIMGQYTSPNGRTTSPGSPHNWLMPPPPMAQSAGSNSSSSYPSATRTPAGLPKQDLPRSKKRSGSAGQSTGSWEDDDKMGPLDDDDQPWGMPQDQYKALNPRDKKQVRNRIGARRFRAKRKDYVSNLEKVLSDREDEITGLRTQVDSFRSEINDLRHRLGMPLLPAPDPSALGLVVSQDSWDKDDEQKAE